MITADRCVTSLCGPVLPCGRGLNCWGFVTVDRHHINNPNYYWMSWLSLLCFAEDVGRIATSQSVNCISRRDCHHVLLELVLVSALFESRLVPSASVEVIL